MLTKRLIPCLDVKEGRVVKGVQFMDLKDAGDPVELATFYDGQGADELVFLDISASQEGRDTMVDVVKQVAATLSIPFTVGGGIHSFEDMKRILRAGADKVSLNSAAVAQPELIQQGADFFGRQCMVAAIDAAYDEVFGSWRVYTHGGMRATDWEVCDWARYITQQGAGEILLTSMDSDGEKSGFDLALTQTVDEAVGVPVIASGGAGSAEDFRAVFQETDVSAALAASIFHFKETSIEQVKALLRDKGVHVR